MMIKTPQQVLQERQIKRRRNFSFERYCVFVLLNKDQNSKVESQNSSTDYRNHVHMKKDDFCQTRKGNMVLDFLYKYKALLFTDFDSQNDINVLLQFSASLFILISFYSFLSYRLVVS